MTIELTTVMNEWVASPDVDDVVEVAAAELSQPGRLLCIEFKPWLPRVRAKRYLREALERATPDGAVMVLQCSERSVSAYWRQREARDEGIEVAR